MVCIWMHICLLYKLVKQVSVMKETFSRDLPRSEGASPTFWAEVISESRNRMCKSPEARVCLTHWKDSRVTTVARIEGKAVGGGWPEK